MSTIVQPLEKDVPIGFNKPIANWFLTRICHVDISTVINTCTAHFHGNIMYSIYFPINNLFIMWKMFCFLLIRSEVWIIMKASMIRGINLSYFTISQPIIMFVIFSIYVNTGGTLTPRRVLTTFSLVTFIRTFGLYGFVVGALQLSEARVAWKRIVVRELIDNNMCTYMYMSLLHVQSSAYEL